MLTLLIPLFINFPASDGRRWALVERGMSVKPSIFPNILVSSRISLRSKGSPPVSRTFVTPSSANRRTILTISSNERTSDRVVCV